MEDFKTQQMNRISQTLKLTIPIPPKIKVNLLIELQFLPAIETILGW